VERPALERKKITTHGEHGRTDDLEDRKFDRAKRNVETENGEAKKKRNAEEVRQEVGGDAGGRPEATKESGVRGLRAYKNRATKDTAKEGWDRRWKKGKKEKRPADRAAGEEGPTPLLPHTLPRTRK